MRTLSSSPVLFYVGTLRDQEAIVTEHRLYVWGPRACFPRPEFRRDLVSYDALSPLAARGILDCIHWRPAIRWEVTRIEILAPVQFEIVRLRREEAETDHDSQWMAVHALANVGYLVSAVLTLTNQSGPADSLKTHTQMFERQARRGRFSRRPYFGLKDFPAQFALVDQEAPVSAFPAGARDLGWLPLDGRAEQSSISYFRATAIDGVVVVPSADEAEVAR